MAEPDETGTPDGDLTSGPAVMARYEARTSDVAMIRVGAPIAALVLIALGLLAGNSIGLVAFWACALVLVIRWLWVTMVGTRPLVIDGELTDTELRLRTMRGTTTVAPRAAQSLMPVGYKRKGRGPRALVTTSGTFTLYPDGKGFDEFVGALTTIGDGRLRVDDVSEEGDTSPTLPSAGSLSMLRRAQEAESAAATHAGGLGTSATGSAAPGIGKLGTPGSSASDSDLAPGVVAVTVVGSQSLADRVVEKLEAADITALALPSASGIGGVRVTVKEEDLERAREALAPE